MEKAILVTVVNANRPGGWDAEASREEFLNLARSCDVQPVHHESVFIQSPHSKYYIGSGKVETLAGLVRRHSADVVIFSQDLSGSQQRSLEATLGQKTIDRTQLILDIFARRARSMEGKVQVELAQLNYLLPRLAGRGIFLSRLGGGIGTRGPGEQKLETDRRRIRDRLRLLKGERQKLSRRRGFYRERRHETGIPTVALVGYTNAGKSTLFNALTHSDVFVQDKLFSTLDPTVRRLILPHKQKMLLVDTVGLLHALPHHLIDAFRATLEEAVEADLIVHVADFSSREFLLQERSVQEVLILLGCDGKPLLTALNKMDLIPPGSSRDRMKNGMGSNGIPVSAKLGEGLRDLVARMEQELANFRTTRSFFFARGSEDLLHLVYEEGEVLERQDYETGVQVTANLPPKVAESIRLKLERRLG